MIHDILFIRQLILRYVLANTLSARLRALFEPIDINPLITPYWEMILWILMMDRLRGTGPPEQEVFANIFVEACYASGSTC